MTAVEILKSFRSLNREERVGVMNDLIIDFRNDEDFTVIDGVMFSRPKSPLPWTDDDREESRRRVSDRCR